MKTFSLALKNIKKSMKDYSVYFVTLVIAVAIFYIFNSLDGQTAMMTLSKSKQEMVTIVIKLMEYISVFVAIVLGFLVVYANNFIIKRRKKEIGIYLTLGMSKTRVSMIFVLETLIVGMTSLGIGLLAGVGLSQLVSIFTAKMFEANMSQFNFVFSLKALISTIKNFGLIYLVVMIFNVFTLQRCQLIDLLHAHLENEKVKIKNSWVNFIIFILSLVCIGYAYYLLYHGALIQFDSRMAKMLILGSVGTFFFFLSVAGFLLKIVQLNKKTYYKGLNIFVLKQVNNKINTHVVSMTVISLMLLLTIGILSASLSLVNAYNEMFDQNSPFDYSIAILDNNAREQQILNNKVYQKLVKEDTCYRHYTVPDFCYNQMIIDKTNQYADFNYIKSQPVQIIKQSDYNQILKLQNLEKQQVHLNQQEYLLTANNPSAIGTFNQFLKGNNEVSVQNLKLHSHTKKVKNISLETLGNGNTGTLIVNDEVINHLSQPAMMTIISGNLINQSEKTYDQFHQSIHEYIKNNGLEVSYLTRSTLKESSVERSVLFTFIALYLGIIFAIASGTVLAIEQLSNATDNKHRYHILNQLGASSSMMNRSLFYQIGLSFMFPLVVAIIHSIVGLKEINKIIEEMVHINALDHIFITIIFIVIVYGGYFMMTYLASHRIINESQE